MCEVRFGSVLRFQLGVQKVPFLPITKKWCSFLETHKMKVNIAMMPNPTAFFVVVFEQTSLYYCAHLARGIPTYNRSHDAASHPIGSSGAVSQTRISTSILLIVADVSATLT
jgi:hypothetical protein